MTYSQVIGIDEVGRGCWAGPLVAAAVVLDPNQPIAGLADSKKLSAAKRQSLDADIRQKAVAIGVGWVWPETIDISGITEAVKSAMSQAADQVLEQLKQKGLQSAATLHDTTIEILIDGSYNFLPAYANVRTLVGADGLVPEASAASIVAKVARDTYMSEVAAQEYPQYGFDRHVGYGTALHIAALQEHGVTPIHRRSYKPIRQLLLQSDA
ncbi:MAG TPA: ribonuclease HII [Candidatus Saccharimonadales bacterium]|jgi:ribonuclease HII